MKTPVEAFWELARFHAKLNSAPSYFGPTTLEVVPPPAWSFGATPEHADELLALVLDGTKTATASALWEFDEDEQMPERGTLSILLDGAGHPRALVEATDVSVVPFDEVTEEHAFLEGEGDRTLAQWRDVHERYFTEVAAPERGFSPDMPVVLERFRVVYQAG
ncbi:ASCH domain-containing protein [Nocardioides sp. LHG3406-4]|uniref:ASCH domain-containing protein n=1 Tax=Nocardioides sp. LHG3406-4 TaxID=2804575 RepID=UPI003CF06480